MRPRFPYRVGLWAWQNVSWAEAMHEAMVSWGRYGVKRRVYGEEVRKGQWSYRTERIM